jgi:hypothetical protein
MTNTVNETLSQDDITLENHQIPSEILNSLPLKVACVISNNDVSKTSRSISTYFSPSQGALVYATLILLGLRFTIKNRVTHGSKTLDHSAFAQDVVDKAIFGNGSFESIIFNINYVGFKEYSKKEKNIAKKVLTSMGADPIKFKKSVHYYMNKNVYAPLDSIDFKIHDYEFYIPSEVQLCVDEAFEKLKLYENLDQDDPRLSNPEIHLNRPEREPFENKPISLTLKLVIVGVIMFGFIMANYS